MGWFSRLFSRFRNQAAAQQQQPVPTPVMVVPTAPVVNVPVGVQPHELVPPLKPVANPVIACGDYTIRANTEGPFKGLFTVVETQQTWATLAQAQDYCQRLTESMRGRVEGDKARAGQYSSIQPGEIDVNEVEADDFLFYAANYPILNKASPTGRLLGPWYTVASAMNWLQCQGGEPTAKLAAAFPTKDSQFMQHLKYQNEGANSYTGRFRAAYDQNK